MAGMHRATGARLSSWQHVAQSILDILTTPIGTRVMRRDYGARLLDLVDRPMNELTITEATIAVSEALERWEPRFKLKFVTVFKSEPGLLGLTVTGVYIPDGHLRAINVEISA
ncbi:MAG: GPW/gp25 family protein [Bacteroidota bacterium]